MDKSKIFIEFISFLKIKGLYPIFIDVVGMYVNVNHIRSSYNGAALYGMLSSPFRTFPYITVKLPRLDTENELKSYIHFLNIDTKFYIPPKYAKYDWDKIFNNFLEYRKPLVLNKKLSRKLSRRNGERNYNWHSSNVEEDTRKWYEQFNKTKDLWRR